MWCHCALCKFPRKTHQDWGCKGEGMEGGKWKGRGRMVGASSSKSFALDAAAAVRSAAAAAAAVIMTADNLGD